MSAPAPARPDPDALLALAAREGRGRLKLFLGAAPGVGKTVEMLTEARRLRDQEGRDVLVGLVETHGRAGTEAAVGDLPVLPRRRVARGAVELLEFDLDAALARRPQILLLDELAHTNGPGSRHPKRWQDVEELRDAGVEVWTTMNVQHLESSAEAVARVTGVRVAETVPDAVLASADAVELVDIPPAELLERMCQGRIYRSDQAERALRGFFKEGALDALRELALRRTAERVDADVTGWMRRNAVGGPWPVGERVLVLLPGGGGAEPVLLHARRLADALRAPLLALHVERPGRDDDPGPALALAQRLGAEAEVTAAPNLVGAALAHARARNASHIVVGRGRPALWRRALGRTLAQRLAREARDFALHIVPAPAGPGPRARAAPSPARARALPHALAVPALVGVATLASHLLDGSVPESAFGMVYLAAVVALAALAGPWHAAAGAALAFLCWNFLFLPPRYTLTISSAQDILGVAVFGLVAALLAGTTSALGRNVRAAAARLAALRQLAALSRRLSAEARPAELHRIVAEEASRLAGGASACVLLPLDEALAGALPGLVAPPSPGSPPEPVVRAAAPADAEPDEASLAAARWAMANRKGAGRGTATLPAAAWRFWPLSGGAEGGAPPALLGLQGDGPSDPEAERALAALLDQAGVALARARLAEEAAAGRARREGERLRTALLTSLGHDLRTPLTAIRGAAETLRTAGERLPDATRDDLLLAVEEEASRMSRWTGAILDLARLEAGEVRPRREPVDVAAALGAALEEARRRAGPDRPLSLDAPPGLPQPRLDAALLGRVLENLVDNALKHTRPGDAIRLLARRSGPNLEIAVEDDGPGIAPADLPRVFDPFFRAERRGDAAAAGSGLGLAICKGLVEAMGGRIAAESPAGRGGARVTLRFPVA